MFTHQMHVSMWIFLLGETDLVAGTTREDVAIEDPTPMKVQVTPKRRGPTLVDGSRRQRSHSLGGGANSPVKRRTGSRHQGFRPRSIAEWESDQRKLEKSDTERSRDENSLAGDEEGRKRGGNEKRGRNEDNLEGRAEGQGGREEEREGGGKVGGSEGGQRDRGGRGKGGGEWRGRDGGSEGREKKWGEGGSEGRVGEVRGRELEDRGSDGKAEGRRSHRSMKHWYSTGSVGMSGQPPVTRNGLQVYICPVT